ncbi:hypothetical protein [Streptomyces antnestii]|uniref:hypothetical protein n=1 Tax=Streptomyces antnestii TaxID=2494256 RepID=UPI0016721D8C|nr:hypothetical protein [Streptomyces sp. San01]
MAVSAAPRALLMLGGGVIADRLGPRRIVIAGDGSSPRWSSSSPSATSASSAP